MNYGARWCTGAITQQRLVVCAQSRPDLLSHFTYFFTFSAHVISQVHLLSLTHFFTFFGHVIARPSSYSYFALPLCFFPLQTPTSKQHKMDSLQEQHPFTGPPTEEAAQAFRLVMIDKLCEYVGTDQFLQDVRAKVASGQSECLTTDVGIRRLIFDLVVAIDIERKVNRIFGEAEDPEMTDKADVAAELIDELTTGANKFFPNIAVKIKDAGSSVKVVECMQNFKVAGTNTYPAKIFDEILNERFQLRKLPSEAFTAESGTEKSDNETDEADTEKSDTKGFEARRSDTKGSDAKGSDTKGSDAKESDTQEPDTEEAKAMRKDINRIFSTPSTSLEDMEAKLDALTEQGKEKIYPEFLDKVTQANLLLTMQIMEFESDPNGVHAMEKARIQRYLASQYH